MSNPARELHEIFLDWRTRHPGSSSSMLNVVEVRNEDGAAQMLRVYRLLARIDTILGQLEADGYSVSLFRRQVGVWVTIPLGLQGGWANTVHVDNFIPQTIVDQVEGLALFLDGKVYVFDAAHNEDLRGLLRDVRGALEDDDDELPRPLKLYIHRLLVEIQHALDDEAIGEAFDFADAVRRLWVALGSAENSSTEERSKSKWRRFAERILFDSTAQSMVTGGQAAITLAIESLG